MAWTEAALLAGAAVIAGAINAIAGGGTLVSFPAAIAAGLTPLVSNATNAVALTPASVGSAWAYRRELRRDWRVTRMLLLPSAAGGMAGAALLLSTPQRVFDAVVPGLVLLATLLLLWQNLRRRQPAGAAPPAAPDSEAEWNLPRPWRLVALQFLVGIYGGYFGAGMGIMMLAMLSAIGGGVDIHRMNGVKAVLAGVINGIASIAFVAAGAVDPTAMAIMGVGAVLGGFGGAALARKVDPTKVRWAVVAIGLVLTAKLAWERFGAPPPHAPRADVGHTSGERRESAARDRATAG